MSKRVLFLGDSPFIPSGYAKTTRLVTYALMEKGYDVYTMALNVFGGSERDYSDYNGVKVLPNLDSKGGHTYSTKELILSYIYDLNIDLTIFHNDFYRYAWVSELPENVARSSVFWLPYDQPPIAPDCWRPKIKEYLSRGGRVYWVSKYGYDIHKEAYSEFSSQIGWIRHFAETWDYFSRDDKGEVKKSKGLEGKFVICRVDRNQPRKNYSETIEVLKRFMEGKGDVVAILKTNPKDASGSDLEKLVEDQGLADRIIFDNTFYTNQDLNKFIYNVSDVFLTTSGGEGFGLAILEAMLAEVIPVMTNVSVAPEILGKHGILVDPVSLEVTDPPFNQIYRAKSDIDAMVNALTSLYLHKKSKPEAYVLIGKKCREHAEEIGSFETGVSSWCNLIESIPPRVVPGLVSIVIPAYKSKQMTEDCVRSIIEYTRDNIEIIVVSNGLYEKPILFKNDSNIPIEWVIFEKNEGFSKACNAGVRKSSGEFILLLNNDTVIQSSDWISILMKEMEDPKVGIVGPAKIRMLNDIPAITQIEFIGMWCALIRRSVWDAVDGIDERYTPAYWEDYDFSLAVQLIDYKIVGVGETDYPVTHVNQASKPDNFSEVWNNSRSRFIEKWKILDDVTLADVYKVWQCLVSKASRYFKEPLAVTMKKITTFEGGRKLSLDWASKTSVDDFYKQTKNYIYDLLGFNVSDYYRSVVAEITNYVSTEDRILDFGAGIGFTDAMLKLAGYNPVYLDLEGETSKFAGEFFAEIKCWVEMYSGLQDVPGEVSKVLFIDVLEHLENSRDILETIILKFNSPDLFITTLFEISPDFPMHLPENEWLKTAELDKFLGTFGYQKVTRFWWRREPKVSIIMPTYNRLEILKSSIENVKNQTFKDWELIIVDDCSIDGTSEYLQSLNDPQIKVVCRKENAGYPNIPRNDGISQSVGKYLIFRDDDISWNECILEVLIERIQMGYNWVFCDRNVTGSGPGASAIPMSPEFDSLLEGNYIDTSGVLIKRSFLEVVGYFREDLKFFEDWELFLRLAYVDPPAFVDEELFTYHWHGENRTYRDLNEEDANKIKFWYKKAALGEGVTIGIPTRNRIQSLVCLLSSILNQVFLPKQILVINDGDKDLFDDEMFSKLYEGFKIRSVDVTVLPGVKKGPHYGHQIALEHALFDHILRLDDDLILDPHFIHFLYQAVSKEDVDLAGGVYPWVNMTNVINSYEDPRLQGKINHLDWGLQVNLHKVRNLIDVEHLHGSFLAPTRPLRASGGYPRFLSNVGFREETIVTHKMHKLGYRLKVVPNAIAWHFDIQSGGTKQENRNEKAIQDNMRFQSWLKSIQDI